MQSSRRDWHATSWVAAVGELQQGHCGQAFPKVLNIEPPMDGGVRPRRWCLLALLCAALAVAGQAARGLEAPPPGPRRRALGAAAAAGQNGTLIYRADVVARISGENFVPFTLAAQEVFLEGFREVLSDVQGPVQMVSYRWAAPLPATSCRCRHRLRRAVQACNMESRNG